MGNQHETAFSLYQGEDLSEEQSVLGEIDEKKIPITGNSRFGCWCCTLVKEDKSLQSFINKGSDELKPLREFRNWLVSIRQAPDFRDTKRRNGTVYTKSNGEIGFGPFTLEARRIILKRLLELQKETQMQLITIDELKVIDEMWDADGDLERRHLVDTYYDVMGERLPWDEYKVPMYHPEIVGEIEQIARKYNLEPELMESSLSPWTRTSTIHEAMLSKEDALELSIKSGCIKIACQRKKHENKATNIKQYRVFCRGT